MTSGMKASSPTGMWSLLNQLQMLILLLLVNSYVPTDVSENILQQDFAMMNFNFLKIHEVPYLNYPTTWMDFAQKDEMLNKLGFKSRSTFTNLYSFVLTLILIAFIHALLAWSTNCKRKDLKKMTKLRTLFSSIRSKVLSFLMYSLYVRLFLQAHQSFLLSGLSEIYLFNIDRPASIISIVIAIIFIIFSLFLVIKAYYMLYRHWNGFEQNQEFFFMEYYADIRDSKWARCYTSALLTRRLIFIVVILLFRFLNRDCIFGILLAVQFFYLLQLLVIRPFKELENNIVETVNEVFYITFISLMLYLDGDAMWTETMTAFFVSLITANSLVITIILLSNFNVDLIAFFVIALIKWWRNREKESKSKKLIKVIPITKQQVIYFYIFLDRGIKRRSLSNVLFKARRFK
jgi:hypothetical protein